MTPLGQSLKDYLAVRRSLGYKLEQHGKLLSDFVAYIEDSDCPCITTSAALAFATQPADASPNTYAGRLSVVRGFAQHVSTIDPRTEIPPPDLLPHRKSRRLTPSLYSVDDVRALMEAARTLRRAPAFSRATTSTLIGVLAVTGMRVQNS